MWFMTPGDLGYGLETPNDRQTIFYIVSNRLDPPSLRSVALVGSGDDAEVFVRSVMRIDIAAVCDLLDCAGAIAHVGQLPSLRIVVLEGSGDQSIVPVSSHMCIPIPAVADRFNYENATALVGQLPSLRFVVLERPGDDAIFSVRSHMRIDIAASRDMLNVGGQNLPIGEHDRRRQRDYHSGGRTNQFSDYHSHPATLAGPSKPHRPTSPLALRPDQSVTRAIGQR